MKQAQNGLFRTQWREEFRGKLGLTPSGPAAARGE